MAGFLLDTKVVGELVRPAPDPQVAAWILAQRPMDLFLSAISLGELARGIGRIAPGQRRGRLARWLDTDLPGQFPGRILAFGPETALIWGRLMAEADRRGRPKPAIDAMIAATAKQHGLALATRNLRDLADLGLNLVDPWRTTSRAGP